MTKDEALKLALEALEEPKEHIAKHRRLEAITAIKEVLAQHDSVQAKPEPEQEPVAVVNGVYANRIEWKCTPKFFPADGTNLYTTPPQPKEPEQEPVAYLDEGLGAFYFAKQYKKNVGFTPLYTTPPQRTWVGLTDEDKQTAFDATQEGGGFWEFADAIEAKLKEKNT